MANSNDQYGVVYPKGFKASGVHAKIKKKKKDIGIIYSEAPATASGAFTKNLVKAAPVILSEENINNNIRAIVINSGNANACTGKQGYKNAVLMQETTAEELGIAKEEVLVASTGVIGVQLPIEKILEGIREAADELGDDKDEGIAVAEAIMTTDTFRKQFTTEFEYEGKEIRLGGICKGSGMIHPNMATMLGFVTTDAAIEKNLLDELVKEAVNKSFNSITVDGDTSTNDMVAVLANGASGVNKIADKDSDLYAMFAENLIGIMKKMAKSIVLDGEGATKFIEVKIKGAKNEEDAIKAGKSVATSSLVKTAAFGEDANWGRILAAVGYSGIEFNPYETNIYIGSKARELLVCEMGQGLELDEDIAKKILSEKEIYYLVEMDEGKGDAVIYTCDLTYDYVKINGSYRS